MEKVVIVLLVTALVVALGALFLVPSREVAQAPGRGLWIYELLFPGTSPTWHFLGGLALVLWIYLLLQDLLLARLGSPYILLSIAMPNLERIYGVQADPREVLRMFNPSWLWVYLAPGVLFLTNVVRVLRKQRRGTHPS